MKKYKKVYEDDDKQKQNGLKPNGDRQVLFHQFVNLINYQLQKGDGFVLSDFRAKLNSSLTEEIKPFSNREIRVLLYDHFGSNVCLAESKLSTKSAMVF